MRQLTLTDLQKKPRGTVSQDSLGNWLQAQSKIPFDETLLTTLVRTLGVQDGTAVVEFNCGKAAVTANFSSGIHYHGFTTEPQLLPLLKAFYPSGVFTAVDPMDLLTGEPSKAFGLAIVNGVSMETPSHDNEKAGLCTEYQFFASDLEVFTEVALKSVVDSGLVAIIVPAKRVLGEYYTKFIEARATIRADINYNDFRILIAEPTSKPLKAEVAKSFEELVIRTPIASSDPRPFCINKWDIKMVSAKQPKPSEVTQLVRSGKGIGWNFANATDALTWAGTILENDNVNPWMRAVSRIKEQFSIYNYLRLKESGRPLWDLALLKQEIQVEEAPDLAQHLQKVSKRLSSNLHSYPDNTDVSNRYWSLGPGDRLQHSSGSVYQVLFTEVDPTDDKPPKLTLETV